MGRKEPCNILEPNSQKCFLSFCPPVPRQQAGEGVFLLGWLPPLVDPSLGMAIPVYTAQGCKGVLIVSSAFKPND